MTEPNQPAPTAEAPVPVRLYLHVVLVALLGAASVLAWLAVYTVVNRFLWESQLLVTSPWLAPLIVMPFSLLVGLLVKYRRAPTSRDESLLTALAGDPGAINWRELPVNVLQAWASLWSGAVLGPEGGIGGIASKVAAFYAERMRVPAEMRSRLVFATLASAYNGLVASPLFTGVLGTELVPDSATRTRTLPANLLGGALGFLVFELAGSTGLQDYLQIVSDRPLTPPDVVLAVVFGLVGMVLAILLGLLLRLAEAIFGRFGGRVVERTLAAGVVFSIVGMAAPILLFSGETQAVTVVANPAQFGAVALIGMALAKLALLALALRSGFLGGPTFPAIFAAICVAQAIALLAPGVPLEVAIGGVMSGLLVVLFRAPFMVILLGIVMLGAGPNLAALIVFSTTTVLIVMPGVRAAMDRRRSPGTGAAGGDDAGADAASGAATTQSRGV